MWHQHHRGLLLVRYCMYCLKLSGPPGAAVERLDMHACMCLRFGAGGTTPMASWEMALEVAATP